MIEAVQRIKAAGVTVAIASNKPHADTVKVVEMLYPKDLFSLVLGRTSKFTIKPAPDALRFIMGYFGVSPEESVYVGDSDVDVQLPITRGCAASPSTGGFAPWRRSSPRAQPVSQAIRKRCRNLC
jgi:phosphoglycolate phosphatase